MNGTCKFCGQLQDTSQPFLIQELCDEYVTNACICSEAKKNIQSNNAKLKIKLLFSEYDEESIPILIEIANNVINYRLIKSSVTLQSGIKCNMKIDGDGNIIIERIVTEKKKEIATQKYTS